MIPVAAADPGLRRRLPFRLGTTSYIYPAGILPNVRSLKNRVEDIEIVLFESDEVSNYPSPSEVGELAAIGEQSGVSYTVHLPLDVFLGDPDRRIRQRSAGKCLRAIAATSRLKPHAYILHCQGTPESDHRQWLDESWLIRLDHSIVEILDHIEAPRLLCAETLSYPFQLVEDLTERRGLGICLDVGHVLLYHQPLDLYLQRYLPRTRVIHLHGNSDGRDHLDLSRLPAMTLDLLFSSLAARPTAEDLVLTLEVFSEEEWRVSRTIVEEYFS
jgi:sugar phosphate isomerase/epimerase